MTVLQARARRIAVPALAVVAVDWVTKAIASRSLDSDPVRFGSILDLRLTHNPGVAFGLGDQLPGPVVLAVTAAVTTVLALAAIRGAFPSATATGVVLGGAAANFGDRLVGGSVVDFFDLGWWPSFNIADIAITLGCGWLLVTSWRQPSTPATSRG